MKTRKHTILPLATLAGLAIATGSANAATTLTGLSATNAAVPAGHGSNAVGTPNIALSWIGVWQQYANWDGRTDSFQIETAVTIDFTPDAGFAATITSFDLDEWGGGGGDMTVNWSISGGISGTLASGTWDDFNTANDAGDAGGRSTVTPNVIGADGEVLTLSLTQTGGDTTYLAMDNLAFDQVAIPEPSSVALLGLGGIALILRRRK